MLRAVAAAKSITMHPTQVCETKKIPACRAPRVRQHSLGCIVMMHSSAILNMTQNAGDKRKVQHSETKDGQDRTRNTGNTDLLSTQA